ncbi:MAG: trypsin-like serine protease [Candidatus Promineifilaceae bacterium]|nr:trypsin-like serine protease [Candidatus Promineifilaceae bacterium]
MRNKIFVLALVLMVLMVSVSIVFAITNGQPDGDAHPYVGLLVFDVEGNPAWRCSGSLIAPNVVLTAGHCTDGTDGARIWFNEMLQDPNDGSFLVPDYPGGGIVAIEGTPFTNPYYQSPDNPYGGGNGLPAFSYRDVGVVVLDEQVNVGGFAELPSAGYVDTLRNKADMDYVGYGVQEQIHGGGPPFWTGLRNRMFAPGQLVSKNFVHAAEFIRLSANPGNNKGGTCFGDSGGPTLAAETDMVLGVNSYVTNGNCSGVSYSSRVDIPEILDWIYSFLPG